jgi:hypothetical protein
VPSRKQRRRRAKERRHEYEFVYVDEEGREVEVDEPAEQRKKTDGRPPAKTRSGRVVEPASWNRVGRRALIFAPLMFITIRLLDKQHTPIQDSILRTVFLLALFLPFSYVMDSMLYRSYLRRTGASRDNGKKR